MKTAVLFIAMGCALTLCLAFTGCSSKVEVPPVTGLDLTNATAKLQEKGFTVANTPGEQGGPETVPGSVLRQSPAAGQPAAKGSAVQLTVDDSLFMPSFAGLDLAAAQALAQGQRLQVSRVDKRFTGRFSFNAVLSQMPQPNTRVLANSTIVLTVEEYLVVPNLLGLSPADARTQIEQAGLQPGSVRPAKPAANAIVSVQSPKPGVPVAPNTTVDLKLDTTVAQSSGGIGDLQDKGKDLVEGTRDAVDQGKDVVEGTKSTVDKGKKVLDDVTGVLGGLFGGKGDKKKPATPNPANDTQDPHSGPASSISTVSLQPRSPATLPEKQPVRISFRYVTDERRGVIISAIPQRNGQPLPRVTGSVSRLFTATAGEGTLEVAVAQSGAMADELRLEMRPAKDPSRLLWESRVPFQYQFGQPPRGAKIDPIPGKLRGFPLADDPKPSGVHIR